MPSEKEELFEELRDLGWVIDDYYINEWGDPPDYTERLKVQIERDLEGGKDED